MKTTLLALLMLAAVARCDAASYVPPAHFNIIDRYYPTTPVRFAGWLICWRFCLR